MSLVSLSAHVAPMEQAEARAVVTAMSPEARETLGMWNVRELARLVAYRRAVQAGYFNDGTEDTE
jgi:hypothetical protein